MPISTPTLSKTLDEAISLVTTDDTGKWDSLAPCKAITLHNGRLVFPQATGEGYEAGLALSPWATTQLCHKLALPTAYFKRCPVHLQDENFNYWNQSGETIRQFTREDTAPDEAWLLRAKGQTVRGVLSPRYARLDNRQVMDAASAAGQGQPLQGRPCPTHGRGTAPAPC